MYISITYIPTYVHICTYVLACTLVLRTYIPTYVHIQMHVRNTDRETPVGTSVRSGIDADRTEKSYRRIHLTASCFGITG